jgi:transcriptional/translational regulatory protein YebC/TACO1
MFDEKGVVSVSVQEENPDMDKYVDMAIEVGAEEVKLEEDEEGKTVLQVK